MGLGSHCQVTEQLSRKAWKEKSPRNRGIWLEVEGGPGALRTGWTCLTRSAGSWRGNREQERGGRELVRQGQLSPQACEGRAGEEDAGEGVGKDSGREGRDKKGKVEGRSWRWAGPELCGVWAGGWGGPPPPRTLVSHTPPGSAPIAPDTCSAPSGFLLLWFPILNPLAQATTSLREDGALSPRQQPPGLMEKTGERTLFQPGGQS